MEEINEEVIESTSQMTFKLDNFDGPIELLVHLTSERNIEIKDVKDRKSVV